MKSRILSSFGVARRSVAAMEPKRRILMWATIVGLIVGAVEFGAPLEDALRSARNQIRKQPASGDIVVVGYDERSMEAISSWPWPRSVQAKLVDELNRQGARRIFFDLKFIGRTVPQEDQAFVAALMRSKAEVTLASSSAAYDTGMSDRMTLPDDMFGKHAQTAIITAPINFSGTALRHWFSRCSRSNCHATFAAKLGGLKSSMIASTPVETTFPIDYSIDIDSIPAISAIDVIRGKAGSVGSLAGKDVVLGTTALELGDQATLPIHGRRPGVYVHVIGGETLKRGVPSSPGWIPALMVAFVFVAICTSTKKFSLQMLSVASAMMVLLGAPLLFEERGIWFDVLPGILLLLTASSSLIWTHLRGAFRRRGTVNARSGLANLDALRSRGSGEGRILVATRIGNYARIASALPADAESLLVEQIANRLTLGDAGQELFQGDEGIFAWFADLPDVTAVGEHLDALHGFFRSAVTVGDRQIDLSLAFGVDVGTGRPIENRLGSALVACDEAAAEGRRWKAFDPKALDDAAWKLSLLGQLDQAIDTGDLWVAYQPKIDLATGTIVGAEALARWTHPDKGAIAPLDFILAAEQSDRIEKLTRFVLDEAISAAARINLVGSPFNIAVNLSTRMINDDKLPEIVETLLRTYGLPARCLTLEITETAALSESGGYLDTLAQLREVGVMISIDDYGTGLSTLEYLKKIPATEIKIDQSFIAGVTCSRRDRLMVESTIHLAHSLGRSVVAEGVEDGATLKALTAMGCDQAQGFHIGRPMRIGALNEMLIATLQRRLLKVS